MLILGIESSTKQVGCALASHEGVLASAHSALPRHHAESLTPSIDFVCRSAGVSLSDVSAVAVDIGPGLFTGLRVGIAAAKAIAFALSIPMVGVSSLDLLAFPVSFSSRRIAAVIDARRGEVFYAFYRHAPGGVQRLGDPVVATPDELVSELIATRDEQLLIGDGAQRYAEHFSEVTRVEIGDGALVYPSAVSLVQLAHARALREEFVSSWELQPLYLRKPDAEINWMTRDSAGRPQP